jgi:cytochrome P450
VAYWRYCLELVGKRFAAPQDDLPSDLVGTYQSGDQSISTDEIAGPVYGQLTAGHETTTALLANGLKELLLQRDCWVEPCPFPELIPNAVEELLLQRDCWVELGPFPELIPNAVEEPLRIGTPVRAWKRRTKRRVAGSSRGSGGARGAHAPATRDAARRGPGVQLHGQHDVSLPRPSFG